MSVNDRHDLISRQRVAETIAAEAGKLALHHYQNVKDLEVESKNPRDFVSEADRLVEQLIRDRLSQSYPDDGIVGEEGGGEESDAFWSVDPIDGTSNFLAGIPLWGVSIGFCLEGDPVVGAICIPTQDILVSANRDVPGIRCNAEEQCDRKTPAIPTMVLGQGSHWDTRSFRQAEDIFRAADLECLNYRCSVIGIAFAVLGRTHGYYEERTNLWDVAAGCIIARQAGLMSEISRDQVEPGLTFSILTPEIFNRVGSDLAARQSLHDETEGASDLG